MRRASTRPRIHAMGASCAPLLLVACSSTVVQPDGDGGSGPGGAGSGAAGTGGAGGEAPLLPCTRLVAADPGSVVVEQGASNLAMASDGASRVLVVHQSLPGSTRHSVEPWGAWPPPIEDLGAFDYGYLYLHACPAPSGGTTVIASEFKVAGSSDLFLGISAEQPAPSSVPVLGETAYGIGSVSSGYVAALETNNQISLWGLGMDGDPLWERPLDGCTSGLGFKAQPTFLAGESVDLAALALADEVNGSCLIAAARSLLVVPLDGSGEKPPVVIDQQDAWTPQALGMVRRPDGGARLIYGDFSTSLEGFDGSRTTDYGILWQVPLDVDGTPTGTGDLLGLAGQTAESASVVPVTGGFVVARFVRDEQAAVPTHRVAVGLFDDAGQLLQDLMTDVGAPADYLGVRSVASPDGRSVLLGWTSATDVTDPAHSTELRLMRFDCVEP